MLKQTRVIAGFPGVGKSFFRSAMGADKTLRISDSDSSQFHWIVENGEKKENPNFIEDYLHHIKSLFLKVDIIFVSTHENVLLALEKEGINFTIVYPDHRLKEEYIRRYRRRKSPESFIQLLDSKFDQWVDSIEENYLNVPKIKLVLPEEYLEKAFLMNCDPVDLQSVKNYIPNHIYGKASYQKTEQAEEDEKHKFYAGIQERADLKFRIVRPNCSYLKWIATIRRESRVDSKEFSLPEKKYDILHFALDKSLYQKGKRVSSERIVSFDIKDPEYDKSNEEWLRFLDKCLSSLNDEVSRIESKRNNFIVNEFEIAFQNFSNYGNRIIIHL